MRFSVDEELTTFAASVRAAIGAWEAPREPTLGTWWDEHDVELAARLGDVGWSELWEPDLRPACVAGAVELGRAIAPLSLVDRATLGAPLAVDGLTRHAAGTAEVALVEDGLSLARIEQRRREPSLDGVGTERVRIAERAVAPHADARLTAWGAATLGYLAGLSAGTLDHTVAHVRAREQFGAPLSALPTLQARLADAALAVDGLHLLAWEAAAEDGFPGAALTWAGVTAREVTLTAHQSHGAIGFALESGVHRAFRRAKSTQVWSTAVVRALSG